MLGNREVDHRGQAIASKAISEEMSAHVMRSSDNNEPLSTTNFKYTQLIPKEFQTDVIIVCS